MPNIKSAKKRVIVNQKKTEQNKNIRSAVKTEIKKIELLIKENKIEEAISQLEDPIEILILRERYINCFTWEEIECRTDYSRSYIFKMHQSALNKIKVVD